MLQPYSNTHYALLVAKPENCCCASIYGEKTLTSQSLQKTRKGTWVPCDFYSSLVNQIMCNKQSAVEFSIPVQSGGRFY